MKEKNHKVSTKYLKALAKTAWQARECAYIFGTTKVGAAVLSHDKRIFMGCNVEHKFRSHDVHAEVNAITSMIAGGQTKMSAIVIVADRERFTPCGACMDWIFQFGGPDCVVAYQSKKNGNIKKFFAKDLMPFYPK